MKFLENEARYHAYEIAASILQSSLDDKAVDGICELNHFSEYTTGEVKKTIGRIIKALEPRRRSMTRRGRFDEVK